LRGANVRAAERVGQAIEDLGFRPQPAAQSLKSRVTRSVAVVVPDITNPYFASVVKGIDSIARNEGYNIFLYNSKKTASASRRSSPICTDEWMG
jgi:LacI family transcriptional regulator